MSREARNRSVFVGNIPYDATEEQLKEIFQEVGQVVSFRLVFDRDTGKAKGYGFCEYRDTDTALSAVRNLNGYEINGRPLRVGFAEAEMRDVPGAGPPGRPTGPTGGAPIPAGRAPGAPSTGNPVQEVTKVLQEMSTQQIYEIMVQMKGLIQQNPDQARQILSSNPQVAYALLQAQILLGYVTPAVAQQLLVSTTPGPAAMMAGPMQPIGMPPQSVGQPPMMPPGPMQGGPMSYGAPPGVPPGAFVPQPVTPYGIPPVAVAPPPVAAPGPGMPMPAIAGLEMVLAELPPDQRALVVQVLALNDQQIAVLPDAQRQQVQQVRQMVINKLTGQALPGGFRM